MTKVVLDYTGLRCPLPVLKLAKAMRSLGPGETVEVLATDPGAVEDFEAYCRKEGHAILAQEAEASLYRFRIRKGG